MRRKIFLSLLYVPIKVFCISIMLEPTLSTFCPMPMTFYTCSWEIVSTGRVAATRTRNYTLQGKEHRASFWRVGVIWFFSKHRWFQVEKQIIIPLPPWQGVVSVIRVIYGIIDRWIQARPSANKYMSCIRTFSIFANSHSLFCAKLPVRGKRDEAQKNIHKEDSCFGYAAISICNRDGKHAHSYPRQCSDLLLTLKMDLPDIRCLVHANCYGK